MATRPPFGETFPLDQSASADAELEPLGAIVRVLDAPANPPVFRLSRGVCRIGSGAGCNIIVNEPTVSRAHVEFALHPQGVQAEDLESRNGTFYLGQRVQKMVLSLGARIQMGRVSVVIDADTDQLEHTPEYRGDSYRNALGAAASMRRLFALLARLEASLTPVLLEGESGVGKEVIARALHEGSQVADGPLVILNCGALPRELVASELFGHKKGAFTGAADNRKGAFESAHGGTLFLDEIGELPLDLQPMLLRALEAGEVRPIGGDVAHHVRVRLIAATNRELLDEVRQGRFREDLFYRLAVVRLRVPPLRERLDDIAPLAARFATDAGLSSLPSPIVERLKTRRWDGNVRELRNTVQAYAALGVLPESSRSKGATLDLALRELVDPKRTYAEQKDALVERFTAVWLESLLELTAGNQTAAARYAGLDRGYLGRLVAKYGLTRGPRVR